MFSRKNVMTILHKKRFSLIGYLLMWNYVSSARQFFIHRHIDIVLLFSVGIGWTDDQKMVLIDLDDFQLENCQFQISFTFDINHSDEMFTQPSENSRFRSFTCCLLSRAATELKWQIFECPMSFPQCHYNWCVTGEHDEMVCSVCVY